MCATLHVQVLRPELHAVGDDIDTVPQGTIHPRQPSKMNTSRADVLLHAANMHDRAIPRPSPSLLHDIKDQHGGATRCGRERGSTLGVDAERGRGVRMCTR